MVPLRRLLKYVLLFFFLGYIAFIPTGPYPLLLKGQRLDHLFAYGTLFFSLLVFPFKWPKKLSLLIGSVLFYLIIAFFSTALSIEPDVSCRGLAVTVGYALIAVTVPFAIHPYMRPIRVALIMLAAVSGAIVIWAALYEPTAYTGRFHLSLPFQNVSGYGLDGKGFVDPNMTAIGLMMCVIVFLQEALTPGKDATFFTRFGKPAISIGAFAIIFTAVIILLSRSAVLSFLLALSWAIGSIGLLKINNFNRGVLKKTALVGTSALLAMLSLVLIKPEFVQTYWGRVARVFQAEFARTESDRILYFWNTLEAWAANGKTLLLGQGFFTLNPHNEILRTLGGAGLFGLFAFLSIFYVFHSRCCRMRSGTAAYLFTQNMLLAYVAISIQFYGHTKSMWAAFTFLLANYLAETIPKPKGEVADRRTGRHWIRRSLQLHSRKLANNSAHSLT